MTPLKQLEDALLRAEEEAGLASGPGDSLGSRIAKLPSRLEHSFFRAVRQLRLEGRPAEQDSERRKLRPSLGTWYSAMILGDLWARPPARDAPPDAHLRMRMHGVLREAIAWVDAPVFAQVIVGVTGPRTKLRESIALPCRANSCETCDSSCPGRDAEQLWRKKINEYTAAGGTSCVFDVHLREDRGWSGPQGACPRHTAYAEDASPSSSPIYCGDLEELPVPEPGSPRASSSFIEDVAKEVHGGLSEPWMCHLAAGVDIPRTLLGSEPDDAVSSAHLYVLVDGAPRAPRGYDGAIRTLLARLAHFHAELQYAEEHRRLKSQELMLSHLKTPLATLTDALQAAQRDAQQLRDILYEPAVGLFAVQDALSKLFTEGLLLCNPDESKLAIRHDVSHYQIGGSYLSGELAWILARAVSDVLGVPLSGGSPREALLTQLENLEKAAKEESPTKGLALQLQAILNLRRQELVEVPDWEKNPESGRALYEAVADLKVTVFSHLKADLAASAIKWKAFGPFLPPKVLLNPSQIGPNQVVIQQGASPYSLSAHFVVAAVQAIGQLFAREKDVTVAVQTDDTKTKTTLEFRGTPHRVPQDATAAAVDLATVLQTELAARKQDAIRSGEYGDFRRPWVNLLRRLPHERAAFARVQSLGPTLTLTLSSKMEVVVSFGRTARMTIETQQG